MDLPPGFKGDPWEWFGDEGHLAAHPWSAETRAARDEINRLGYGIDLVEDSLNSWVAILFGGPNETAMGWKVARAELRSEAAEAALKAVREHELMGEWPQVDRVETRWKPPAARGGKRPTARTHRIALRR